MAAINGPDSSRQKMINLMYIVLMAMLALNVSSDVLNGFSLVDEGLNRSTLNSSLQNNAMYKDLDFYMARNPEKVKEWYSKAQYVRQISDSLFNYVEDLKYKIVKEADGDDADVTDISNKENLEAATYVMLAPGSGKGKHLYEAINNYRTAILAMITDSIQQKTILSSLSTNVPAKVGTLGKNWQEYIFENTPAAAAVTLLTKLQSDVRYAEGEVLHTLVNNIDVGDLRVNQVKAYVIPTAKTIVRGNKFSAQVILAAVDTTKRPAIFIDDKEIASDGKYELLCNQTGQFKLSGYLKLDQSDGSVLSRPFEQEYTVVEPSATVSATLMNIFYAGFDNPISVSVPGVPSSNIRVSIAGGKATLKRNKGGFVVRPLAVGKDITILVTANAQVMGRYVFHVRQLPDPTPFVTYTDANGHSQRYKGGTPLSKMALMNSKGILAAIDDGLLSIDFKVLSFETVFFDTMGNAVPELSNGSQFSNRQRSVFRNLSRGKRFYISRVRAIGPDGIERVLPTSLEVIVN